MDDTAPLELEHDGGMFRCDISRKLAKRIHRASRKSGLTPGQLWDWTLERYGDEFRPGEEKAADLYEDCESGEEAKAIWVRTMVEPTVEEFLDSSQSRFPDDEELA